MLFLILWACGDPTLDLDDYDQSCTVDEDCVVVETALCGCSCDWAAIHTDAVAVYEADVQSAGRCRTTCFMYCDPATILPMCDQGSCTYSRP